MLKSYPLTKRFLVFVVLPLLFLLAYIANYFFAGLPLQNGSISISGLEDEVSIIRDSKGTPKVIAKNDKDVFFATGLLHAQDRLFQLEMQRRIGRGTLSEVLGKSSLNQDIWFRTLGLANSASSGWNALSEEAKSALISYSNGINTWINLNPKLPPEFIILGIRPEPWTPIDSLIWLKVFSLNLSGNFNKEIKNSLQLQMPPEIRIDFEQEGFKSPSLQMEVKELEKIVRLNNEIISTLKIGGRYNGSNAWAISGKLTDTGASILANDPHLGLQIPSMWYAISQQGDSLSSAGMSLIGLPLVIFGRNRTIAWGGTSMMADVQDLFVEQINPKDPTSYLANGKWIKFEIRRELVNVRADFPSKIRQPLLPVEIIVRNSRHGPIISGPIKQAHSVTSLKWTALDPSDTSFDSFLKLNYVKNWHSFKQAFREYVSPALNIIYSDIEGNIGFLGVGRIPIRSKGNGTTPSSGSSDEFSWIGYIPFDHMPNRYNPPEGYLVLANDKMVDNDYPYFISIDWASSVRADRIADVLKETLKENRRISIQSVQRLQVDVLSRPAQELVKTLLMLNPADPRQSEALVYLRNWNGEMSGDSQAASIFNVWVSKLKQKILILKLREKNYLNGEDEYLRSKISDLSYDEINIILTKNRNYFCDNKRRLGNITECDTILSASLNQAISELENLKGANMKDWRWKEIHFAKYDHFPLGAMKLLGEVLNVSVGNIGASDTVNVSDINYEVKKGYIQKFGASFRQIISLDKTKFHHFYIIPTGQSGNPFSAHYKDMVKNFRENIYYEFDTSEKCENRCLKISPVSHSSRYK